ncbi:MAG: putative uridylate kinase [Streblomastix strix]|uniref:Putative uridylate kinase n=1 Tax=Streblomastix strix TaxID=222440 RepID=A0A5J4X592_9EUKA|nr:MAG: putative uridylate kinase [Streblomastix strix]
MNIQTERIFCAEQIQVPLELPEILKAFTKECIRAQPENLVEFAANYFAQMAENVAGEGNLAIEQFTSLRRKACISLNYPFFLIFEEIDNTNIYSLPRQTVTETAMAVGFGDPTIEGIFNLGKFDDPIDWREFLVLAISLAAENLLAAFEFIFMTFATQEDPSLDTQQFLQYASYLTTRDPSKPPDFIEQMRNALQTENGGAFSTKITFEDFAGLAIAEKLR